MRTQFQIIGHHDENITVLLDVTPEELRVLETLKTKLNEEAFNHWVDWHFFVGVLPE